jgi:integrase
MIGRGYHQSRRKDGVKDGTIIREIVTLRAALRTAKHDKMYSCDVPHVEAPAAPPPRERWLTKDEATALLDAAVSPHIQLFIMLALDTGARKGAIFDLTWDRVSDDYSRINYTLPGRPTSNKRRAIVATTKRVRQALKNAQQLAQTDHVIEYNGKRVHNIQNAWGKTLKKSGIDHITIHGLRHTCATWLVMSGMVKHDKIARMLGTTKEMIDKVYGHHSPHYLSDAVSVLENH